MGMNSYPISHYTLFSDGLKLIQPTLDRLLAQMSMMGITPRGISGYFSYGQDLSELLETSEEGIEHSVLEALTVEMEELPAILTREGIPEGYKYLAKQRLESGVDEELLRLAEKQVDEGWSVAWGQFFESKFLEPAIKEMSETLGIAVYLYTDEHGHELFVGIEHEELFEATAAHKALKEKLGGSAVQDHSWTEWG